MKPKFEFHSQQIIFLLEFFQLNLLLAMDEFLCRFKYNVTYNPFTYAYHILIFIVFWCLLYFDI